jgi:hypothetical protein
VVGGSTVLKIAIGMIRTKAMATLLGPAVFGLFGVYGSVSDLSLAVAGMGVNRAVHSPDCRGRGLERRSADRPDRRERHNPRSITTLRMALAHHLIDRIPPVSLLRITLRLILGVDISFNDATKLDGNGSGRSSKNRSPVPRASVSPKTTQRQLSGDPWVPSRLRPRRSIDNRARDAGPGDYDPTCASKTDDSVPR